nr:hypothetical protein Iba_chr12bCG15660 [Ipomoea batatas]
MSKKRIEPKTTWCKRRVLPAELWALLSSLTCSKVLDIKSQHAISPQVPNSKKSLPVRIFSLYGGGHVQGTGIFITLWSWRNFPTDLSLQLKVLWKLYFEFLTMHGSSEMGFHELKEKESHHRFANTTPPPRTGATNKLCLLSAPEETHCDGGGNKTTRVLAN